MICNNIPILDSGKGWLAVDKPSGMSIHNDPGYDLCSVIAEYIKDNPDFAEQTAFNPEFGVNPVHRLDKLTSGVILMACTVESFYWFSKQFENRSAGKKYIAIVHGQIKKKQGLWTWPLSKKPGGRSNPAGAGKKMPSQTGYKVIRQSKLYSLVECELMTGRKHQIRRHAALAGHSIAGDSRYGTSSAVKYLQTKLNFHRLGLHSTSLSIYVPNKSKPVIINSKKIPADMEALI
ncbi:Pseudouridine synthase, RluC/RluD-like [Desulfonema limicola]|uniref:Pseudouridine synthase, RluC/RluD-like n=1 Tax=Desulfonema limicola TaxID=45656 RepID=A0A975B3L0_9BACT|nr:RNA pseudouridine synthase [Desulfonema limicola]QTA78160.1 Pseudouridine synthase, RluC/RluD-like [Desulfonema limicola]